VREEKLNTLDIVAENLAMTLSTTFAEALDNEQNKSIKEFNNTTKARGVTDLATFATSRHV
jgi:hypothetical protein